MASSRTGCPGGLTSKTFADVQNIRLSGDIRLRGISLIALVMTAQAQLILRSREYSFISQRTRVSVEADLEDHVLVVVTLRAESLWALTTSRAIAPVPGMQC